jgi:hypothetical protein
VLVAGIQARVVVEVETTRINRYGKLLESAAKMVSC